MLPYFILVFVPATVYILELLFRGIKRDKLCISMFFVFFLILLFFRSTEVGIDLQNYEYYYNTVSRLSYAEVLSYSEKSETLYFLLNKIVADLGGNFRVILIVAALVAILPIFYLYYKKTENALLTIALFLCVAPFSMFFSGLRQTIAMGIVFLCFRFVEKKKIVLYLIGIFIAYFFHRSAIFCLPIYLLYHAKITKKWLYVLIPSMIGVFIFNKKIFSLLVVLFDSMYSGQIESTGAYSIIILLFLFTIYSFVFSKNNETNNEFIGLRNLLLASVVIQCFAPLNSLVMRINYYYLVFVPILISQVLKNADTKYNNIINISTKVMIYFFILYFFYKAYYGADILQIFPYISYWR